MPASRRTDPALQAIEDELLALEPTAHRPAHGTPRQTLEGLIAPAFWEVAASGLRYGRERFVEILLECASRPHDERWVPIDVCCQQIATDTFLLSYSLWQGTRLSHRVSLWQRGTAGWQTVYHQGTVVLPVATPA